MSFPNLFQLPQFLPADKSEQGVVESVCLAGLSTINDILNALKRLDITHLRDLSLRDTVQNFQKTLLYSNTYEIFVCSTFSCALCSPTFSCAPGGLQRGNGNRLRLVFLAKKSSRRKLAILKADRKNLTQKAPAMQNRPPDPSE